MSQQRRDRPIWLTVAIWVLTALVLAGVGMAGVGKLVDPDPWVTRFQERWGYPGWFALVVGTLEAGGSLALLVPRIASAGGFLVLAVMLGAVGTHLTHAELGSVPPPLTLAILALTVALLRRQEAVGLLGP